MSRTREKDMPAILGGIPIFKETLHIVRPSLPKSSEIQENLEDTFQKGLLTNGKYVAEFEARCAEYLETKEAVAVSSATSALLLTEKALELTGEVIVPSFTFSATVHSLIWNGLTPVFVDCLPHTYNLNPILVENAITDKTSAILAVYIFGNPPDISRLEEISKRYNLKLIFDTAHGFGAKYQGKLAGGFGDAEIFSLTPTKIITSGEGGLITTNDTNLAQRLRLLRNYGNEPDYDCQWIGLNARMLEFSAILGLKSLEKIEEAIDKRNYLAFQYQRHLSSLDGIQFQQIDINNRSTYKDFSILIESEKFGLNRNQLALALKAENIETRKYFYPPVHLQKAYQYLCPDENDFQVTIAISSSILCLPFYTCMEENDLDRIVSAIFRIYSCANTIAGVSS